MSASPEVSVAIIGAGFAGLGTAIALIRAGHHDFTVFESEADVGGTWRDNTYPGCACDVPSHLYSFSFERKADWTRKYGEQGEILEYLRHCADIYGIRPHLRLGTRIVSAQWDADAALWRLRSEAGESFSARVLVSGTGPLSVPAMPDLPGLSRFRGRTFHSARWDHGYDLTGRRVAVIGTGASAIQFVPRIAPQVQQLHLFQRTPPWIVPKPDRAFSRWTKRLFSGVPGLGRAYRDLTYWALELRAVGFVVDPRLMRALEWVARRHIAAQIPDPELRAAVTPSYTPGCKRILISSDYYPALTRPNVELVTDAVTEITEHEVVTADGRRRPVDAILFGTGFRVTEFLSYVDVVGRDGVRLHEAWRDGAEAYYGMTVNGFPNLFIVMGPNTGIGHTSVVFMIEAQVHYLLSCLDLMKRRGAKSMEVHSAVQRGFNERVQTRMADAVWTTGCKSWYLDERGRNFALWPGFTFEYWLRTRRPDPGAFALA